MGNILLDQVFFAAVSLDIEQNQSFYPTRDLVITSKSEERERLEQFKFKDWYTSE